MRDRNTRDRCRFQALARGRHAVAASGYPMAHNRGLLRSQVTATANE
jgi:hypothetical protein